MNSSNLDARLVVTGFGPFGDHDYNPSWDAARALGETLDVDAHLLSVTFNSASQFAGAHLRANSPRPMLFVHFGLAARRTEICFERRAKNERDHTPDELEKAHQPKLPDSQPIHSENRRQRFSRLDFQDLITRFDEGDKRGEFPAAKISEDCGNFVCNALLYHSLHACEKARGRGQFADALFIHIPPMDQNQATLLGHYLARQVFTPLPEIR
jgi:pyroglutamyl-peptidase